MDNRPGVQRGRWAGDAALKRDDVSHVGYSGTPLVKKLGIKEGYKLVLVGAPRGWEIPALPDGVKALRKTGAGAVGAGADVIVAFYDRFARLAHEGPGIATRLAGHGALWIAWPRRAGGHESDITDESVRRVLLPAGVVDVKVAALDQDWSGLKFVRRRENRPDSGRLGAG